MSEGSTDEKVESHMGIVGRRVSIAGVDEIVSFHLMYLALHEYSQSATQPCPFLYTYIIPFVPLYNVIHTKKIVVTNINRSKGVTQKSMKIWT